MDKKSKVLMAALTLTALVLGTVLISSTQRPAMANMLNAQDDFSLMTTGVVGDDEALVVIDKGSQKMVVYKLTGAAGGRPSLDLIAAYDLAKK